MTCRRDWSFVTIVAVRLVLIFNSFGVRPINKSRACVDCRCSLMSSWCSRDGTRSNSPPGLGAMSLFSGSLLSISLDSCPASETIPAFHPLRVRSRTRIRPSSQNVELFLQTEAVSIILERPRQPRCSCISVLSDFVFLRVMKWFLL